MSKEAKAGRQRKGEPDRGKAPSRDRGEAARRGHDADDFSPNEARAGDPGRESNRGG